jgi:hypothetical protein
MSRTSKLAVISSLWMLVAAAPALADNPPPPAAVPADAVVFGRTYGDWAVAWNQWVFSLPVSANPLFDPEGDDIPCGSGQSGPVFFLGGQFCAGPTACPEPGTIERKCTVPAGKYLFFPVVNFEMSVPEFPAWSDAEPTISNMRDLISDQIDQTDGFVVTVDGVEIPNVKENFRIVVPTFGFTQPAKDDLLGAFGVNGASRRTPRSSARWTTASTSC